MMLMGKRKSPLSYIEILRKLQHAGVENSPEINRKPNDLDYLPTLRERVDKILGIVNKPLKPAANMLFFVMYDIESNKVRYNIVKYL